MSKDSNKLYHITWKSSKIIPRLSTLWIKKIIASKNSSNLFLPFSKSTKNNNPYQQLHSCQEPIKILKNSRKINKKVCSNLKINRTKMRITWKYKNFNSFQILKKLIWARIVDSTCSMGLVIMIYNAFEFYDIFCNIKIDMINSDFSTLAVFRGDGRKSEELR